MRVTCRLLLRPVKGHVTSPLLSLPSVIEACGFVRLAYQFGQRLQQHLWSEMCEAQQHLRSRALEEELAQRARDMCAPLLRIKESEVEAVIFDKYKLKSDKLATCIVPYQLAVNMLLARMPGAVRAACVQELKDEEASLQAGQPVAAHRWLQWRDHDVYVSHGTRYLERISPRRRRRIPVFCVMGHIGHGKTTLIDALQGSSVATQEPHGLTQVLRSFTVANQVAAGEFVTLIDTPGHRLFVENRMHALCIADCILLVVSIVEGVQGQVHEIIKVALNVDRPIIVVFSKMDALPNAATARSKVRQLMSELASLGLELTLVHDDESLKDAAGEVGLGRPFFARMRSIDPSYKGSQRKPQLDLQRRGLAVCVSAKQRLKLSLLWRLLASYGRHGGCTCRSDSITFDAHDCAVQAIVLEASKHLYSDEGFRANPQLRSLQRRIDAAAARHERRLDRMDTASRTNSFANAPYRSFAQHNPTSSPSLLVSVVVREGVVQPGMHFVADQAEGQVSCIMDYWGNQLARAVPGMAVTLVDMHSISGCPGIGTHVLSTRDKATRKRIHAYRQLLQWYVEVFPRQLHYLRPRGMDVSFIHLGNYGQIEQVEESLQMQLLFGPPRRPEGDKQAQLPMSGQASNAVAFAAPTFADYLAQANAASAASESEVYAVTAAAPAALGVPERRVGQSLVSATEEQMLNSAWRGLQPATPPSTQEEYEAFMQQCIHVGVLLKVDTWHSARTFSRELYRLGTRRIQFQAVAIRFGGLCMDDILFTGHTAKVIVCYRTPRFGSVELDNYIASSKIYVLHTDHFADVIMFLRWCAVTLHKESVGDAAEEDGVETTRPQMVLPSSAPKAAGRNSAGATKTPSDNAAATRPTSRKRLLITPSAMDA